MSPRPAAAGRGKLGEAVERLEQLYSQLPTLACLGLCENSCGEHIDASTVERRRLLAVGVDLDAPTPDRACPAPTRTFGAGRYSVHAIRPTICRLWGATASMPCPHGCVPDGGPVDDASAMRWMITSLPIGGHSDHLDDPGVQELLELALTDQDSRGPAEQVPARGSDCHRAVVRADSFATDLTSGERSVRPSHP